MTRACATTIRIRTSCAEPARWRSERGGAMATDDERREVARRLRGIKDTREGCGHEMCCDLWSAVFDSDYRCTDLCDECEVAVLNSLADLIEPEPERTCHDETESPMSFLCGECGWFWNDPEDELGFRYCPSCGARVIG